MIKIVLYAPGLKLVSISISGRTFYVLYVFWEAVYFFGLRCGIVVCCDIMMDGFARASVVLIRD